jgi:hypothetical protein
LATVNPPLASELVDPTLATTITEFSHKKLLWFCETKHPRYEWETTVNSRSRGSGCGVCAGQAIIVGWNDLGTLRPDLVTQLVDPTLATTVTVSSDKKLLWFCEARHPRYEWETTVNRRSKGHGCAVCAGRAIIVGWNDLGTLRPDLAAQLVTPADALTVTVSSGKKLLWFCETGHPRYEWEATVYSRSNGRGCGVCAGRAIIVGWNDLGTLRPDLAAQLVTPADALTVTVSSGKKLLWFCETGHPRYEWETTVNDRFNGHGCAVCAGRAIIVGWNDLGTLRPDLAAQLVTPADALTVTVSSGKKLLWFCETGHPRYEWEAEVSSRSNGHGCGVCAGQAIIVGWNDLGTLRPDLVTQLVNPALATTVTVSSNKKLLWFCEARHPRYEWETTVYSRSNGRGCGVCAKSGFDPSKPGSLYRFRFRDGSRIGVVFGISNVPDKRLKRYQSKRNGLFGIHAIERLDFPIGSTARDFEKQILAEMARRGIGSCDMGVAGTATESFYLDETDLEFSTFFEAVWLAAMNAADLEAVAA